MGGAITRPPDSVEKDDSYIGDEKDDGTRIPSYFDDVDADSLSWIDTGTVSGGGSSVVGRIVECLIDYTVLEVPAVTGPVEVAEHAVADSRDGSSTRPPDHDPKGGDPLTQEDLQLQAEAVHYISSGTCPRGNC